MHKYICLREKMSWHTSHISIAVYYELYLFIATWDHFVCIWFKWKEMPKCSPWSPSRLKLSVWYHFEIQIYVMYDYSQKTDSSLATSFQRQSVMWDFFRAWAISCCFNGTCFFRACVWLSSVMQRCPALHFQNSEYPWHFSDHLTDGRIWTLFLNLKLPWR